MSGESLGEVKRQNPAPVSWKEILGTMPRIGRNEWLALGWVRHWLIMVRGAVLIMTLMGAAAGLLLAGMHVEFHAGRAVLVVLGLTLAHATNNLINDYVDHVQGIDRDNYFRRRYGVHVLEDALVDRRSFLVITAATGAAALVCGAWLVYMSGTAVFYLMLFGAFLVLFYTWPLKHYALGELAVLLAWGPGMVAGSYFVMTNEVSGTALLLSFVYGIGPTLVVLGKHIDKLEQDRSRGVMTLPVALGERGSRWLALAMTALQWLLLFALAWALGPWLLLPVLSVPALWLVIRCFRAPPPTTRPAEWREDIWPLWFSAAAFRYCRDFGALLLVALIAHVVLGGG